MDTQQKIREILLKWGMGTRQPVIIELLNLIEEEKKIYFEKGYDKALELASTKK